MPERVCAVVSTFNRKNLLLECLDGLLSQSHPVSGIVVVDGPSTDGTPEALLERKFIPKLPDKKKKRTVMEKKVRDKSGRDVNFIYIRLSDDVGGAGQFHEGVKEAYSRGYDWIWIMDDDVEPTESTLEKLLKYRHISMCIHPVEEFPDGIYTREAYVDVFTGMYIYAPLRKREKEWTCTNVMHFEGVLVHRDIIGKIGFPDPDMFIGKDDIIYGLRSSPYTNPIVVFGAVIKKKRGSAKKNVLSFKPGNLDYYYTRNHIRLINEIKKSYICNEKVLGFFYILLVLKKLIVHLLHLDLKGAFLVLKGYVDGRRLR